jgi:hypothetical protein
VTSVEGDAVTATAPGPMSSLMFLMRAFGGDISQYALTD